MIVPRLLVPLLVTLSLTTQTVLGQDNYDDDYEDYDYNTNVDSSDINIDNPDPFDVMTKAPVIMIDPLATTTREPDPSLQLCARDKTLNRCPDKWSDAAAKLYQLIHKVKMEDVTVKSDYASIRSDLKRLWKMFWLLKSMARFTSERVFFPSNQPIQDPSKAVLLYTPENQFGGTYDDCQAAFRSGNSKTGVYLIRPKDAPYDIRAYCDNGWTVIQRRFDGNVKFYRPWSQYLAGFGNYSTEFWLGLENIYQLTQQEEYTIRFDMQGYSGKWYFITYPSFSIGNEASYYELSVGNVTQGSIEDAFTDGNGYGFSTMDKDNDGWFAKNCANHYFGAWWSSNCGSDLNRRLCKSKGHGCMEWAGIQMEKSLIRIKPSSSVEPDDLLPGA